MINAIESCVWNQTNNQSKGLVRVREKSRSSLQLPQVGRQGKLELLKTVENASARPVLRLPIVKDECSVIGLSRHWDGLVSTSAMWLIADDGGIEQPNGSIQHQ